MLTALAGLAAAAASAVLLFPIHGHVGVALGISACGWVSAVLLGAVLLRRRRLSVDRDFWRRIGCIVLATVAMGIVIAGLRAWLSLFPDGNASSIQALTIMTMLVLGGLSVYVGALRLFGVLQITETFRKDR
jgi:putative peptidoglycan lipid II flippase